MNDIRTCAAPRAPVYLEPRSSSEIETELLYGQEFKLLSIHNNFAQGEVLPFIANPSGPAPRGYVKLNLLSQDIAAPDLKITSMKAPVFLRKDIKSPLKMILPLGARLSQLSKHRNFMRIGRGQYVHRNHIGPADHYEDDFVDIAEHHLGLPYIWGGVSTDGLDCSGLVQSALWAVGKPCPRNSGEQLAALGRKLDEGVPLMRGDLVFWKGHVGIMQDGDRMIHANAYHMRTESEPLTQAAHRIKKSAGPIIAIKRL